MQTDIERRVLEIGNIRVVQSGPIVAVYHKYGDMIETSPDVVLAIDHGGQIHFDLTWYEEVKRQYDWRRFLKQNGFGDTLYYHKVPSYVCTEENRKEYVVRIAKGRIKINGCGKKTMGCIREVVINNNWGLESE